MNVDETPSTTLAALVMNELNMLDTWPPQDEYAAVHEHPPAYGIFGDVYAQWDAADKAKQAIAALDNDSAAAAAEKELKDGEDLLKEMKMKSEEAFKALHTKRSSFASFKFSFRRSKRKSPQDGHRTAIWGNSNTTSPIDRTDDSDIGNDISQLGIRRSMSIGESRSLTDGNQLAAEEFGRIHGEEMKQFQVVQVLKERVAVFKRKREELSDIASAGDPAWTQLQQIADETLLNTPESAMSMGDTTEKLEAAENAYNVARKTTADLTRARLAVQHSHHYFTRALNTCDDVRSVSTGGALFSAFGTGMSDMSKMLLYRESVTLASKAQICLNEVFRVLEPHEYTIPEDRMEDYRELKKMGVMQMSKIYNLMFGGRMMATGVAGSVKLMLERQETSFAHLTRLAVWIQNRVPVCTTEEKIASTCRDDVRREVAEFWNVTINHSGQV